MRSAADIEREGMLSDMETLRAEIARLRAYTSNPRYWEARWRDEAALTTEAAAFLDRLSDDMQLTGYVSLETVDKRAADCRAMAARLRGGDMSYIREPCPDCLRKDKKIEDAADHLDAMAERFVYLGSPDDAADCRAQARKAKG